MLAEPRDGCKMTGIGQPSRLIISVSPAEIAAAGDILALILRKHLLKVKTR